LTRRYDQLLLRRANRLEEQKIDNVEIEGFNCLLPDNIIKFTRRGSINISSKIAEDKKNIVVSLNDTGLGIDPSMSQEYFLGLLPSYLKGPLNDYLYQWSA
jgi:K+-sensing histidine kinase KdpD